jgi:hypothetical protein
MKRTKNILFAAIILSSTLLWGCNSGKDPNQVLGKFFDALYKKDIIEAQKMATHDSKLVLDLLELSLKTDSNETAKFDKSQLEFGKPSIEGNKAVVSVKDKRNDEMMNFTLKKENGIWKVAFDKSTVISMGMEKMKEKGINLKDSMNHMLDEFKKIDIDSLKKGMHEGSKALDSVAKILDQLKK